MSSKHFKMSIATITALGLLLAVPNGYAGGAMTIVPAPDSDVPHGDRIPARRIEAVERRLSEFDATPGADTSQPAAPRDRASTSH